MVTDVSSVGLDWLYLHTDKPILLTDPHGDLEALHHQAPISRCADIVGPGDVRDLVSLLDDRLAHDEHHLARVAMHFHDTSGRAIANVAASYARGIRVFDAAAGGLGGCPYANSPKGNLAMEDLLSWCNEQGIACDISDPKTLAKATAFIRPLLGRG